MSTTNATHLANLFLDHCMVPFGISTYLLMENCPQFVSMFLASVYGYLRVKHFTTTTYYLRTYCQAVWFI